jgi:hypothetical protein
MFSVYIVDDDSFDIVNDIAESVPWMDNGVWVLERIPAH